jgi:quinol monooxygenase YgiN
MYARATVVITAPDRVDAVVDLVRDRILPVVDDQPGSLGLSMNVDRANGRCTVTSVWKDRGSMHASEPALEPLRAQAERVADAPLATEEYEVAVLRRLRQAEPGCWVRGTQVSLDPAQIDAGLRTFKRQTLPAIEALPGFRSALLLVDRRSGHGVVSVVFDDKAALDASRGQAGQVRDEASATTAAEVLRVVESEIVVAGLRLPLSDAPQETSPAS